MTATHRHDKQHRGLVPDDQLSGDTPTDGQVLTWHSGTPNVRTWDTPSGGGGGGGSLDIDDGTTFATGVVDAHLGDGFELIDNGSGDVDINLGAVLIDGLFGDGSDGDCTINSGAFTLAVGASNLIVANVLQRDAYFNNLTLNGGDLITGASGTGAFRVFVKGTLTMTSGVIRANGGNGGNGGNGSGAAGGTAGTIGTQVSAGTLSVGPNAVAGRAGGFNGQNAAAATVGNAPSSGVANLSSPAASGGNSGQTPGLGGAGGTVPASTNTLTERPNDLTRVMSFKLATGTGFNMISLVGQPAGAGAGGGGVGGGGGGSGGTGAGGGPVIIIARTITGTTDIQSKGGNGGNGGNAGGADAGGGGGANGGSGGFIGLVYHDKSGYSGTLVVSGGTAGTGGTGVGTGASGGNGATGGSGITAEWKV